MQQEAKAGTLKRLNRIAGQVRGLAGMVEEDRYCIDILTQLSAVRAALRKVEDEILRDHVNHCVAGAIKSGNKSDQRRKIDELMEVFARAERRAPRAISSRLAQAGRNAEQRIGGTPAEHGGQNQHDTDPADPIPSRARKDVAERESQERDPRNDADDAIDNAYVHGSKYFCVFSRANMHRACGAPIDPRQPAKSIQP